MTKLVAPITVARAQIEPVVGRKRENLAKSADWIERAAQAEANLIVLPAPPRPTVKN